jgi:glutaminyl-peptide cyclotransferase
MHRTKALLSLVLIAVPALAGGFSGPQALEFTRKAVSFGERPAGSPEHRRLQDFILSELKGLSCEAKEDPFRAQTPLGVIKMRNIVARFPGTSGQAVVISGHSDTKRIPGTHFIGANDGGSSTGFLLALAHALSGEKRRDDVYLVWFDGEEAIEQWSEADSLYGSRHLARRWAGDGTLKRIKALINVDMIGDKDLGILREMNSSPWLVDLVWRIAHEKGYSRQFLAARGAIEDDHIPFARAGVPVLNLIDFSYGAFNRYWHTADDTMDKLSPTSFQIVGDVLLEAIRRLEDRTGG